MGRSQESQGEGTKGLGWRRSRGQALVEAKQIQTNNNTELLGKGSGRLEIKEQTIKQILKVKGIGRLENNTISEERILTGKGTGRLENKQRINKSKL